MTHEAAPQPHLGQEALEQADNLYLNAIAESKKRIAEAEYTEFAVPNTEGELVVQEQSNVDVAAERYAQAANYRRARDGATGEPATAEEFRKALDRGDPKFREMTNRWLADYEAAEAEGAESQPSAELFTSADRLRIMRMPEAEARDTLHQINHDSVALLDPRYTPSAQEMSKNTEFATLRSNAIEIELRLLDLAINQPDAAHDKIHATIDRAFAEDKIFRKIAAGEQVHYDDASIVLRHAIELQHSYREGEQESMQSAEQNPMDVVPDDPDERRRFRDEQFGGEYDPANMELFKAFVVKELHFHANKLGENQRYPDTIAIILGRDMNPAVKYLGVTILRKHPGQKLTTGDMAEINMSAACKNYLDLDVYENMPNYAEKFDTSSGRTQVF